MKLFQTFNFLVLPLATSATSTYQKQVYKRLGAAIKRSLNEKINRNDGKNVVLLLSLMSMSEVTKQLKVDKIDKINIPIVECAWAEQCILKDEIVSFDNYKVKFEDSHEIVVVDEEDILTSSPNRQVDKLDHLIQNKRTLENDETTPSKKQRQNKWARELLERPDIGNTPSKPNQQVITILKKLRDNYLSSKVSPFKVKACNSAIDALNRQDEPINTYEQARKIPGIGDGIAKKIVEIVETGNLMQLKTMEEDPKLNSLTIFQNIYGVGPRTAEQWYSEGLRDLEDVQKRTDLTEGQVFGLKYYKDWLQRIPREEVTKHYEFVQEQLKTLEPNAQLYVMGSYRRNKGDCGDVDFILTGEKIEAEAVLGQLIAKLTHIGYIKCGLAGIPTGKGTRKFMGGGQVQESTVCRRVDFLSVPYTELGAAFIYFTGDDNFNRAMRQLARDSSMELNNHGLYELGPDNAKGRLLESFDEKRIFDLLHVRWREPAERNIG